MCKIFAVSGLTPKTAPNAMALLRAATPALTEHDKDGFGYAVYTPDTDSVFVERWLQPSAAWKIRSKMNPWHGLRGVLRPSNRGSYASFGPEPEGSPSILIAHSRMATCNVSLANVHPFVVKDNGATLALIHNGVVGRLGLSQEGSDNCDSMGILNAYKEERVHDNPDAIRDVVQRLNGSFACAVIGKLPNEPAYLDIFRNSGSSLYAIHVREVGLVFCTSESIICAAAIRCNFHVDDLWVVETEKLIRLDGATAEVVAKCTFPVVEQVSSKWYLEYGLEPFDDTLPVVKGKAQPATEGLYRGVSSEGGVGYTARIIGPVEERKKQAEAQKASSTTASKSHTTSSDWAEPAMTEQGEFLFYGNQPLYRSKILPTRSNAASIPPSTLWLCKKIQGGRTWIPLTDVQYNEVQVLTAAEVAALPLSDWSEEDQYAKTPVIESFDKKKLDEAQQLYRQGNNPQLAVD